jgi:hypothetical protein
LVIRPAYFPSIPENNPVCTKYVELFAALAAPFARDEVKTRPQGGRQLSYVTARTIMNRLDHVVGPENWWDDYTPMDKSVICRLTIRLPDGEVVTKVDAGGCADMADAGDGDKSGFSDAFKRAAVKFGVGRYLYRDGVATLTAPSDARPIMGGPAKPTPAIAAPAPPPAPAPAPGPAAKRPGSDDAQGRGGKLAYGQAAGRRAPRIVTGEDLHYYAADNTIDGNLINWITNSFNPQGWPERILDWTPDDVRRALPSIKEHLETVKQAQARIRASA